MTLGYRNRFDAWLLRNEDCRASSNSMRRWRGVFTGDLRTDECYQKSTRGWREDDKRHDQLPEPKTEYVRRMWRSQMKSSFWNRDIYQVRGGRRNTNERTYDLIELHPRSYLVDVCRQNGSLRRVVAKWPEREGAESQKGVSVLTQS